MTQRLIIAEKPSVAAAIVTAMGNGSVSRDETGAYLIGNDMVVACSGHILEQYEPEDYDARYKQWSIDDLPIAPTTWQLRPIASKTKALKQIAAGIRKCNIVVHAGDIDSEGQLLVDEVITYLNWTGPVQRVLIADLNPEPIRRAFANIRDNSEPAFVGLSRKALSRSQGDWLLGMNCSRLYTLLGREVGITATLSSGRVQSALLGLVARRDIEIEQFKPHDYVAVKAKLVHAKGRFEAVWKPRDTQVGLDAEGRLIDPAVARQLQGLSAGPASILSAETQRKKEQAPLPFSLSELQKAANGKLGLSMQATLDIAQRLYEHFQLTTYPRTDTGYVPEGQHADAPTVLGAVAGNLPDMANLGSRADPAIRSRAFNDKKVTAHHGIVPTAKVSAEAIAQLSDDEKAIYTLVCQRYLAQFYPPAEFDATVIEVGIPTAEGERFVAKGKVWIKAGYREVLFPAGNAPREEEPGNEQGDDTPEQSLPAVLAGNQAHVEQVALELKKTTPPKPYTDATLLAAMTGIHRYVTDPDNRKLLREGDGIGTEATRASILENLIKRSLLVREKKMIRTTATGRMHFHLMPADLTTPDMAGLFEAATRAVEAGTLPIETFLQNVLGFVSAQVNSRNEWLARAQKIVPKPQASSYQCRGCQGPLYEKRSTKKKLTFFACMKNDCGCLFRDDNGTPGACFKGPLKEADDAELAKLKQQRMAGAPPCPECGNPILRYKKREADWHYWRCESMGEKATCESVFRDDQGKPGAPFVLRGQKVELPADGPPCPVCAKQTRKGRTREKKTPILICGHCDSMCWVNPDGRPGELFKKKGKMVKRKKKTPSSKAS